MNIRLAVMTATLAVVSTSVMAQGRPDARTMTCSQVQGLIDQRGAAVITTGQHTYDRFVALQNRCDHPFVHQDTRITTRDTDRCLVYICRDNPLEDMFRWND